MINPCKECKKVPEFESAGKCDICRFTTWKALCHCDMWFFCQDNEILVIEEWNKQNAINKIECDQNRKRLKDRREEIAKAALTGILANPTCTNDLSLLVQDSITIANLLIEGLDKIND